MRATLSHHHQQPRGWGLKTNLFVFLVGLLGDQLGLGQLSFQDGDAVVLHVVLVLQRLPYPEPPVKSNTNSSSLDDSEILGRFCVQKKFTFDQIVECDKVKAETPVGLPWPSTPASSAAATAAHFRFFTGGAAACPVHCCRFSHVRAVICATPICLSSFSACPALRAWRP